MILRTPPKRRRPKPAPIAVSPAIESLRQELDRIDRSSNAGTQATSDVIDRFWNETAARTPLLEPGPDGDWVATFLWQDANAAEVILFANRITDECNLRYSLMNRVPGTDVWHLSYRMEASWRASYSFTPRYPGRPWPWSEGDQVAIRRALDQGLPDPRNPARHRNRAGSEQSIVELPDAPAQPWLARREGIVRGAVTNLVGPDGRPVSVYQPPTSCEEEIPIVIVLDGEVWTSTQDIATTIDNLITDRQMRPSMLVMPHSGGRDRRWVELDGTGGGPAWIGERLLPWIRQRWQATSNPAEVVIIGQSLGGLTALQTVLERPDAALAAISQSAALWQHNLDPLVNGRDLRSLRVWLEVGTQEWVLHEPNERFAVSLAAAGAQVRYAPYNGGHDYACWRGGIADALRWVLPPN